MLDGDHVCSRVWQRRGKTGQSRVPGPQLVLTAEPAPGVHADRPQERLVGVADAVVEGEAGTQQRSGQAEEQGQDDHPVQRLRRRAVQLP